MENQSKKIYFAGSIRGGDTQKSIYPFVIQCLSEHGKVLTEKIDWDNPIKPQLTEVEIYQRDIAMLNEADLMVAECSAPSHGVGLEIAYAIYVRKIPVILLRLQDADGRMSAMLLGNELVNNNVLSYISPSHLFTILHRKVSECIDEINSKKLTYEITEEHRMQQSY